MTVTEAKRIAADPATHPDQLRLAHLKLGNAILRVMPSSPLQRELRALRDHIETMPPELWRYAP